MPSAGNQHPACGCCLLNQPHSACGQWGIHPLQLKSSLKEELVDAASKWNWKPNCLSQADIYSAVFLWSSFCKIIPGCSYETLHGLLTWLISSCVSQSVCTCVFKTFTSESWGSCRTAASSISTAFGKSPSRDFFCPSSKALGKSLYGLSVWK